MGRLWTIVGLLAAAAAVAVIVFSVVDDRAPSGDLSTLGDEIATTSAAAISTTAEVSTTSPSVASTLPPQSTVPPQSTAAPTSTSTTATASSPAPTPTAPLGDIAAYRVRVVNGGAPGGTASRMTAVLQAAGFSTQSEGDAQSHSPDTVVLVGQGKEAAGQAVAAALFLPIESLRTGANDPRWAANGGDQLDILVVAGEDLRSPR
jgi:LytR cell envelope-related transcriptional attenuator